MYKRKAGDDVNATDSEDEDQQAKKAEMGFGEFDEHFNRTMEDPRGKQQDELAQAQAYFGQDDDSQSDELIQK